jgi:hypothetical protein
MKLTIKKQQLEKILIANWTSILNVREILTLVNDITSKNLKSQPKIDKITISRFEPIDDYFLIWIEYSLNKNINNTIECHLYLNGELIPKLII